VEARWRGLVAAAIAAFEAACAAAAAGPPGAHSGGAELLGVYLRGSLPQGTAVAGLSDADFIGVVALCGGEGGEGRSEEARGGEEEGGGGPALRAHLRASAAALGASPAAAGLTKVELRAVALPAGGGGVAAALRALRRAEGAAGRLIHWRAADGGAWEPPAGPPAAAAGRAALPARWAADLPAAFELRALSVCVHGLDLPALLPDSCATPAYQLLPSLQEGVAGALEAAATCTGDAGTAAAAARPLRWALKRCVRAAAELALLSGRSRQYSRDLYFCAAAAAAAGLPGGLAADVVSAAAAYLVLSRGSGDGCGGPPSVAECEAAAALAARLAAGLDDAFAAQMVAVPPGWLVPHAPSPAAEAAAASVAAGPLGGLLRAAARAIGAPPPLPPPVAGADPPPTAGLRVAGELRPTYAWADAGQRAAGVACVRRCLAACGGGGGGDAGASDAELLGPQAPGEHVVVLRGAAAHWPAARGAWRLPALAAARFEATVRLAPSLQFPFVQPALAALAGGAAPSALRSMRSDDFVARLAPGAGGRRPLAFAPREYGYLQATVPPALLTDAPHDELLAALLPPGAEPPRLSQPPRVWVAPHGAISPLHYDAAASFLVQLGGTKRLIFFPPDDLPALYPFPDTHLLRRRSRVCAHVAGGGGAFPLLPSAGGGGAFPLLPSAGGWEVVLRPGDALFFAPRWSHYTESLGGEEGVCTSLTFRMPGQPGGGGE